MTTHPITIEIDDSKLASYADEYLAMCWHVAQHNPAEHGDYMAGDLAERIGREIIRRWLKGVRPELWHHQGRDNYARELRRLATYEPGGKPDVRDARAFHSGRWVARPAGPDVQGPAGGE